MRKVAAVIIVRLGGPCGGGIPCDTAGPCGGGGGGILCDTAGPCGGGGGGILRALGTSWAAFRFPCDVAGCDISCRLEVFQMTARMKAPLSCS